MPGAAFGITRAEQGAGAVTLILEVPSWSLVATRSTVISSGQS
jgi:hypothetical protein